MSISTVTAAASPRPRRWIAAGTVVLLAVATVLVYGRHLDVSPVYLSHDEVLFSLNARSIALTGRDPSGRFLPMYVHVIGNYWQTPVILYVTALFLKVLPLSEISIRSATVFIGTLDVVLTYFVARRFFGRTRPAIVAAALLALTPAHFIHSRLAVDHLYPLPFQLAWLWCLATFFDTKRNVYLVAATASLALGMYTYLAADVVMPLFFVVTCVALVLTQPSRLRLLGLAVVGFVVLLLPMAVWFGTHPTQYADHMRMYSLYDSSKLNPLQGARELLSYTSLTARSDVYWDYFNPSFLFFSGDASLINSTRQAGVFLLPYAVLLPLGIYRLVGDRVAVMGIVVVLGFFLSPLGAVLVGEPHRINRALVMLPFAALMAAAAVEWIASAERRRWGALAAALLAAGVVQFAWFERDYFDGYPVRSSVWFERNVRGAFQDVIERTSRAPGPAVYVTTRIPWVEYYWRFYAIKNDRPDLLSRATYFDPDTLDLHAVPAGALLVDEAGGRVERAAARADLRTVAVISEPNGVASFVVLRRTATGALPAAVANW